MTRIPVNGLAYLTFAFAMFVSSHTLASWGSFNEDFVSSQLIPSYAKFDLATSNLKHAVLKLCEESSEKTLAQTRSYFEDAALSWQRIQHIRFGPLSYGKREFSMQFWPDKKGFVAKRINDYLNDKEAPSNLKAFAKSRYSIGGFNALERLLFKESSYADIQESATTCRLVTLHASNLHSIASALSEEWYSDMLEQFKQNQGENTLFENEQDAAATLLKTYLENLQVVRDLKLSRPMGSNIDKAKYQRLEAWRSELSMLNILANIDANLRLTVYLDKAFPQTGWIKINKLLTTIKSELSNIKTPLRHSLNDHSSYNTLLSVTEQLTLVIKLFEEELLANGIPLGFNSRDGD